MGNKLSKNKFEVFQENNLLNLDEGIADFS